MSSTPVLTAPMTTAIASALPPRRPIDAKVAPAISTPDPIAIQGYGASRPHAWPHVANARPISAAAPIHSNAATALRGVKRSSNPRRKRGVNPCVHPGIE
jgi:hypothetical protein